MTQLLWERGVGKHLRREEREHLAEEAKRMDAYQMSVAVLKRRQQE